MFRADSVQIPPSKDCLAWFERVYRLELPPTYRRFLAHYNGAAPEGGMAKLGDLVKPDRDQTKLD